MAKRPGKKTQHYDNYDYELSVAFQKDCEQFLLKFANLQSLKFNEFAKVWKETNFTYIYGNQQAVILLQQLCENCFNVVKKFIVYPKNIYTQVGAFYLLYGLYYKQPVKEWIKIRLIDTEYQIIYDLLHHLRAQHVLDPLFIFAKMKVDNAFVYVCQRRKLGPEERFLRSLMHDFRNDTFKSFDSDETLRDFKNTFHNAVLDLQHVNNEYQEAIKAYTDKHSNAKVAPFATPFVDEMKNVYTEIYGESSSFKSTKKAQNLPQTSKKVKKKRTEKKSKIKRVVNTSSLVKLEN